MLCIAESSRSAISPWQPSEFDETIVRYFYFAIWSYVKAAFRDQLAAQFDSGVIIHSKQTDGTPACRGETMDSRVADHKMIGPMLPPGIEKIGSLA